MITATVDDPNSLISHVLILHQSSDVVIGYINLNQRAEIAGYHGSEIFLDPHLSTKIAPFSSVEFHGIDLGDSPIFFGEVAKKEAFVTFLRRKVPGRENPPLYEGK